MRVNGGAFSAVGNVVGSAGSEGNFMYDPESAQIVLSVSTFLVRSTMKST